MALVTTVAGSTTTSYVSLSEAETYFSSHWSLTKQDAWAGMSSEQQERLLITSTNVLESLRFLDSEHGGSPLPSAFIETDTDVMIRKYASDQRLSFPRNIDLDSGDLPFVPQPIKDAVCEQAVYLVTFDESVLATQYQGIIEESVVAGPVRSYANYGRMGTMIAPIAAELVRPYLRPTRRMRRA